MQRLALALTALLLAFSSACGASIDAAAKADIDRRNAALQPSSTAYPAPAAAEPLPLAPGQWMTIKQKDEDKLSFTTYKIVGQDGDAFWIEIANDSYYGKTATRMLVAFGDRRDPESFDVRQVITKHKDGRIEEVPGPVLSLTRSTYRKLAVAFAVSWTELPSEDAAVVAGTFAGCYKGRSTVSFAGHSITSDVWWHPLVPINGMVKSVGVDKPVSAELVAFGVDGARSEF